MDYLWSLRSSLRPWITWAWAWIKANHDPLTVVVTFLGVLVAWRYVVLTRRLAEAAKEQAEASKMAAQASADQARTTRLLFEAQQPFVRIESNHNFIAGETPKAHDHLFTFFLENHGAVPAVVTGWHLGISRDNDVIRETHKTGSEVGIEALPAKMPNQTIHALTERVAHMFPNAQGKPVEVAAKVIYQGAGGKTYMSRVRYELTVNSEAVRYVPTDFAVEEA
jgi:hypothetical protein